MIRTIKSVLAISLVLIMAVSPVFASPGYDPGVRGDPTAKKGEYKYKEVIFITGEPIVMDGTVIVSEDAKGTKTTLTYALSNAAKDAKLTRKMVFLNTTAGGSQGNQATYSSSADPKSTETIQVGSDKFTLTEYQFSRSGIADDRKIIKYQKSNWNGRKVYTRNGDAATGTVTIDIDSVQYRYDNYWSSTETSLVKNTVTYNCKSGSSATAYKDDYGTIEYAVSNSTMKSMEYAKNQLQDISFRGGYVLKEGQENVVSYSYDIPAISGWAFTGKRNTGKSSYKMATVPKQTSLFASNIRDVADSYWAAEDIRRAISLDIISMAQNNYFRPLNFISRAEFAKAMVKATNISADGSDKIKLKDYEINFADVEKNHPFYQYINAAVNAGIINGTNANIFGPDEYLTKAQAAAIIVRAMGLEDSSNESSLSTPFADDKDVPAWARKTTNIAHRMGIITSNQDNEIEPNRLLTRAECAVMMGRFIKYLQYDIKKEYRDKIINF